MFPTTVEEILPGAQQLPRHERMRLSELLKCEPVPEHQGQEALAPPPAASQDRVIEIELSCNGLARTALSLIDSGSNFSIFSHVLADEFGIEVVQGCVQKLTTLGGFLLAYGHEVEIEVVSNLHYKTEVLFSEYPSPAICSVITASLIMPPSLCAASSG